MNDELRDDELYALRHLQADMKEHSERQGSQYLPTAQAALARFIGGVRPAKSKCEECGGDSGRHHLVGTEPCSKAPMAPDLASEPILQFFTHAHLPSELQADAHLPQNIQAIVHMFAGLAHHLVSTLPRNPERTVALRKLLESKDAAVRAALYKT